MAEEVPIFECSQWLSSSFLLVGYMGRTFEILEVSHVAIDCARLLMNTSVKLRDFKYLTRSKVLNKTKLIRSSGEFTWIAFHWSDVKFGAVFLHFFSFVEESDVFVAVEQNDVSPLRIKEDEYVDIMNDDEVPPVWAKENVPTQGAEGEEVPLLSQKWLGFNRWLLISIPHHLLQTMVVGLSVVGKVSYLQLLPLEILQRWNKFPPTKMKEVP